METWATASAIMIKGQRCQLRLDKEKIGTIAGHIHGCLGTLRLQTP